MASPVFISRYRVLEEVGRGGMGVVYKAEDSQLERVVAVKTLPTKFLRNKEALRRFLREAKVAAKLDHPNIVPIYDVGEDNGVYFMVMEYLEGSTLRDWLEARQKIDVSKAVFLFKQIARAVDYAHQRKVIHRDIKPDNIMIVSHETVKVMDFGIAVMEDRHSVTQPGAVLGTIAYISPEQAGGKPADSRSDIYSLGLVLYELLTGVLPFRAQTASEMLAHHLSTPPLPPSAMNPKISWKLDAVVLKSLEKTPETRYQSAKSLLDDLEAESFAEKPDEKFIASPVQKEVMQSVESFLSFNPAVPSSLPMDKTKILEGLKALLAQQPAAKPVEIKPAESPADPSLKYRMAVEKIQKDLAAMREEGVKSAADAVEIREKEIRGKNEAADSSKVPFAELEPAVRLYESGKFGEAGDFLNGLLEKGSEIPRAYLYLGWSYLQLKRFREALSAFRKGTSLDPHDGLLWRGVGDAAAALANDLEAAQAYEKAGQYVSDVSLWLRLAGLEEGLGHLEKARRAFAKVLEIDRGNKEAQKGTARALIALSRFEDALDLVRKMAETDPQDAECLRLLGLIYENTDRFNQALAAYEKALSINPRDSRVLAQLGRLHERQNQTDLALDRLTKAAQTGPNPDVYVQLGRLHLKQNEDETALSCFEKAAALTPDNSSIHKELGKLYFQKNDLDQAMVQFEWTISLDPSDPEAHGRLGQIYYKKDQPRLSIREYKTAIQLDPYNPEFHENLGLVYYVEEDFSGAIEELKRAVTLDPENMDYRKALGVIYETKGKLDDARREYQKAAEAVPKDYLAQGLLGRVYLEQGLVHLAIFQLQKAIALEPRSHLMQSLLGKAHYRLGQYAAAVEAFGKALANAPKPEAPRESQIVGKTCFYLGQSLLENAQVKEAEAALKQAAALIPTFAKAHHLLGKARFLLGNREAARQSVEHAARLAEEDPEIFYDLAEMLAQAEDFSAAVRVLQRAVRLDPEHAAYYGFLGDLLVRLGDLENAGRAYRQALRFEKNRKGVYHGKLGSLAMRRKDYAAAGEHYKNAIEASPENWRLHQDLAKAYKAAGRLDEAVAELERAKNKSLNSDVLSLIEEEIERLKKKK